jgi:single-stranded DNA-binding protein
VILTIIVMTSYNRPALMGERFTHFDIAAASEALDAEARPITDVAHGEGTSLTAGDTTLDVFDGAGVTRVTMPDARIELFRVPSSTVTGDRVIFDQGDGQRRTRLQVRADGRVSFHPVLRPTEPAQAAEQPLGGRQDSPTVNDASTATTGSSGHPEQQEQPVQRLSGRLGRDPWFNTGGEQPMAGFPLAVNDDRGKTTWHRVVVFGQTADDLEAARSAGQIKKGRPVDVTGTEVTRKEETPGGRTRSVTEFHATAVNRARPTARPR